MIKINPKFVIIFYLLKLIFLMLEKQFINQEFLNFLRFRFLLQFHYLKY